MGGMKNRLVLQKSVIIKPQYVTFYCGGIRGYLMQNY